tara:strand:+ start:10741 stop:11607 length:867 start_codon:yes stop_codon:yes gene_type:complete
MANIFNLPDFMFTGINRDQLTKLDKIIFLFRGLFLSFIHKKTNEKLFCRIMNFFYSNNGKIYFEKNKYFKIVNNNKKIYFSNKRIDRIIVNYERHFLNLLDQYSINKLKIEDNDLVIDCGANVGELYYSLRLNTPNIEYVAFEPDPEAFECLSLNINSKDENLYNFALSSSEGKMKFYLDTFGANSSVEHFGSEEYITVETKTLDSFNFKNVKLIKLEAEGHELEVLKGSKNTLINTEYITVDYGPEKGKEGKMTLPEVTNFLFKEGFIVENASSKRYTCLFKNLKFS